MAKRRGREFFEVFRPAEPAKGQSQGPESGVPGGKAPSVDREKALAPPQAEGGKSGGGGQTVCELSRSAAGALLLLVIVLLMLSHVWGFYRGRSQGLAMLQVPEAGLPGEDEIVHAGDPADAPSPTAPAAVGNYLLCIVRYNSQGTALRMVEDLRQEFGNKFDGKYGFYYIELETGRSRHAVGVGPLPSSVSDEARALRDRFQNLGFRDETRPFKDAYFVFLRPQ